MKIGWGGFGVKALFAVCALSVAVTLSACGMPSGAPSASSSEASTTTRGRPTGPRKGILDAATIQRTITTPSGPIFDDEQAECLAAALDTSLEAKLLRVLAGGAVSYQYEYTFSQSDKEAISDAGSGCLTDDELHDAMIQAWRVGWHNSTASDEEVECLVGSFQPSVGLVFEWALVGVPSHNYKSADIDCQRSGHR